MMQKIISFITIFFIGVAAIATVPVYTASAAASGNTCGDTKTQIVACDSGTKTGVDAINDLIKIAISVLSVMIGVVAVGGIAYAAIIYASARDNQNQISEARTLLRNIVIGVVLYVFTIAIINWLIPGGVIG